MKQSPPAPRPCSPWAGAALGASKLGPAGSQPLAGAFGCFLASSPADRAGERWRLCQCDILGPSQLHQLSCALPFLAQGDGVAGFSVSLWEVPVPTSARFSLFFIQKHAYFGTNCDCCQNFPSSPSPSQTAQRCGRISQCLDRTIGLQAISNSSSVGTGELKATSPLSMCVCSSTP